MTYDSFEYQAVQKDETADITPQLEDSMPKFPGQESAEQGVKVVNQQIAANPEVKEYFEDLLDRVMRVVNSGNGEGLLAWIELDANKDEPVHQWMRKQVMSHQA